ncbi:MAG: hypothetical protein K2X48_12280 [Chitinophagaceae bacterium]|nr:hypothetical protein [Chitinophagaceae bacterium]
MKREIKIFKSFEEQEKYFLGYFYSLSPSERLKALAKLQKKNYPDFLKPSPKKITLHKNLKDGY